MHLDFLKYAIRSMSHRRLRAWLTILGIVIGIAAIVALISAAQGLDAEIRGQLKLFGSDVIVVTPGRMEAIMGMMPGGAVSIITEDEAKALGRIGGVKTVSSEIEGIALLEYKKETIAVPLAGVEPETFFDTFGYELESGRFLKKGELRAVVIGWGVAHDVFDDEILLNQRVIMKESGKETGKSHSVVGILKKSGGGVLGSVMDSVVLISKGDARDILPAFKGNKNVDEVYIKIHEGADINAVEEAITREMMRMHHILKEEDRDFTVMTPESIQEMVGAITGALTLFMGGIAAISLIVGGVGIANTMYMSVLERTREIGTLKAIGASSSAILEIFLIESGLMGLVGGVIGVVVGATLAFIASIFGVPFLVSAELVGFALFFSVGVGVLSGIAPARSAAVLTPVDALRYE